MYETTLTRQVTEEVVVKHRFKVGDHVTQGGSGIVIDHIDWFSDRGVSYPCYWTENGGAYGVERVDKSWWLVPPAPKFNVGDIVIRQKPWSNKDSHVCVVESNSGGAYRMRDVLDPSILVVLDPSILIVNPHKAVESDGGLIYTKIGETCD